MRAFVADERGATAIEYGLLVALIAMALVGVLVQLGSGSDGLFRSVQNAFS